MLINLTNHPVTFWPRVQREEAERRWGSVTDLPFPAVDPNSSTCEVTAQARELVRQAAALHPDAVLCQGEMTMTMALVLYFQMEEIPTSVDETEGCFCAGDVRSNDGQRW